MKVSQLKYNPANPRKISPEHLDKLKKSIADFPEMMKLRPIVYDPDTMHILGGNQRLTAIKALGMKEIPDEWAVSASELTDQQKKEFTLKDNIPLGEWDFDMLSAEFGEFDLADMGIDLPELITDTNIETPQNENPYTKIVTAPIYEITGEKPTINMLFNDQKYQSMVADIEKADISEHDKQFLKTAAQRHIVFQYDKIAEYYAHSDKYTQELMENSALVIIDFNKAIELGYVKLAKDIAAQYGETYSDDKE